MAFILTSVSPALLAQDMADALVSATFENGEAYIDLHDAGLGTDALASFVYSNDTGCDYKVIFSFDVSGTCTGCSTSAGLIAMNTTNGSFSYTPPLTNCSGTVVCGIRIIELVDGDVAGNNDCSELEVEKDIVCDGSTVDVVFNYCNQVRIY